MKFRLSYRGALYSRQRKDLTHIHSVRAKFHPQFQRLWQRYPLSQCGRFLQPPDANRQINVLENVGDFLFAPLVSRKIDLLADLRITFLRGTRVGDPVNGGDIDNRIKTLVDALTMPKLDHLNSLGIKPLESERPFFCLLQDDSLVTDLAVSTASFLETDDPDDNLLIIEVRTHTMRLGMHNIDLA